MKITWYIIAGLLVALSIIGCDSSNYASVKAGNRSYDIVCIDHVEYLQRFSGYSGVLSPHYKTDGSLYLCD